MCPSLIAPQQVATTTRVASAAAVVLLTAGAADGGQDFWGFDPPAGSDCFSKNGSKSTPE